MAIQPKPVRKKKLRLGVIVPCLFFFVGPIILNIFNAPSITAPNSQPQIQDAPLIAHLSTEDHDQLQFQHHYLADLEFCQQEHNMLHLGHKRTPDRQYSISNHTFQRHHTTVCPDLSTTLRAIRNGKRRWVDRSLEAIPVHEIDWYKTASYFVPDSCDVPALTSNEMCNIMSRWSDVALDGDSIGRHIRHGVLMGLREDLVLGGILTSKLSGEDSPYSLCHCDGVYSGDMKCRQNDGVFHSLSPRALGICSRLPPERQFAFPALYAGFRTEPKIVFPCNDPSYRGLLLVLQNGPWSRRHKNWKELIKGWFKEHFEDEQFLKCLHHNKVHVIWLGYGTSQTPELDKVYELQQFAPIQEFNEFTKSYLETLPFANVITTIDLLNLTRGSQTSDGFHGLSEVNLVKAYHILNVAKFLKPQSIEPPE
eukprot:scaffold109422_cov43-Attheya_sp.AAC.2